MGNWRCVSTLRGDGTQVVIEAGASTTGSAGTTTSTPTSRFMRLGAAAAAISKDAVPWH